jgi:hypothetical protein
MGGGGGFDAHVDRSHRHRRMCAVTRNDFVKSRDGETARSGRRPADRRRRGVGWGRAREGAPNPITASKQTAALCGPRAC